MSDLLFFPDCTLGAQTLHKSHIIVQKSCCLVWYMCPVSPQLGNESLWVQIARATVISALFTFSLPYSHFLNAKSWVLFDEILGFFDNWDSFLKKYRFRNVAATNRFWNFFQKSRKENSVYVKNRKMLEVQRSVKKVDYKSFWRNFSQSFSAIFYLTIILFSKINNSISKIHLLVEHVALISSHSGHARNSNQFWYS